MSTEDRPLPAETRRALDAVVDGPGRIATAAHPDCTCTSNGPNVTKKARAACPQHKPERRR